MFPFLNLNNFIPPRPFLWDLPFHNSCLSQENLNFKMLPVWRNLKQHLLRQIEQEVKIEEIEKVQTCDEVFKNSQEVSVKKQEFNQSENEHEQNSQKQEGYNLKPIKGKQINQTKNISKNFGKAILTFTKNHPRLVDSLLKKYHVDKIQLITYIKRVKKNLNSLQDLRDMWGAQNQDDQLKKCLRILSYHFMRKRCLFYIYNSRIKSTEAHIKYRYRLMQGMKNPAQFFNIKEN